MWKYCQRGFTSMVTPPRVSSTNSNFVACFCDWFWKWKGYQVMLILSVQSHEFQYYVIFIVDCSWLPRLLLGKHEPSSAKPYPQYAKLPRLFVIPSRNFLNELLLLYAIIFLSFINTAMSLQCTPCVVPLMQSLRCCSFPPSVPRD